MQVSCEICGKLYVPNVWPWSRTRCPECFVRLRAEKIKEALNERGPKPLREFSLDELEIYQACAEGSMNKKECARQLGVSDYYFSYWYNRWCKDQGISSAASPNAPRRSRLFVWEENGCERCGRHDERTLHGKHLCAVCKRESENKTRALVRERQDARKAAGQCIACGKQDDRTMQGRVRCAECEAKVAARVQARRAQHRCVTCGETDENTLRGNYRCAKCQEYDSHKRRIRKRGGICTRPAPDLEEAMSNGREAERQNSGLSFTAQPVPSGREHGETEMGRNRSN